jgi:hypothetical protein
MRKVAPDQDIVEYNYRPLSDITDEYLEVMVEEGEISEYEKEDIVKKLKLWCIIPVNKKGYIYFIMSEKDHEIKIGFTSGQIEKRINSLQTGHPSKLKLLAKLPGTKEFEKSIHEKFASFRLNGEWFKPHPDILCFINSLKNKYGLD